MSDVLTSDHILLPIFICQSDMLKTRHTFKYKLILMHRLMCSSYHFLVENKLYLFDINVLVKKTRMHAMNTGT